MPTCLRYTVSVATGYGVKAKEPSRLLALYGRRAAYFGGYGWKVGGRLQAAINRLCSTIGGLTPQARTACFPSLR